MQLRCAHCEGRAPSWRAQYSLIMPGESIRLKAGDVVTRSELTIEYGGAPQGGIVASKRSNMVFVFADPSEGSQFGYDYDGFSNGGTVLHYTGAGQRGDQLESGPNSPILTHAVKGRTIHAFIADGYVPGTHTKRQRYLGEFVLDSVNPFERMPALDHDKRASRTVIVFRLLPVVAVPGELVRQVGLTDLSRRLRAQQVPVEINSTHFFETAPREAGTALRKESQLVDDFISSQPGHEFGRWAIKLPDERSPLLTDVYDQTDRVLYEAKASAGRASLRMAVGQLYDYRRHLDVDGLRCSVLLPSRPTADLRDYVASAGLGVAFKDGDHFSFLEGAGR